MSNASFNPLRTADIAAAGCRALAQGDRAEARRLALLAVQTDPQSEEAWLLLAALASPRTRARFLDHLLLIHPESESARRALDELATAKIIPGAPADAEDPPLPEEILKTVSSASGVKSMALMENGGATPPRPPKDEKDPGKRNLSAQPPAGEKHNARRRVNVRWGTLLISASCILALTATAFVNAVSLAQEPPVMARIAQDPGTRVPTFTPSSTPTITPSFTPTFTSTFTPSPTFTDTATLPPPPTLDIPPIPGGGGERWIDVDISAQRLTAYEGNTPVGTFLVSTGVAAHPTVIGRFRIYVKYLYDDMAGPGYYLPNVPYVMYFYEGYSIHGTYWHHNFGTPMSHGCVNMRTSDAEWIFYWASVGTVVVTHW
jgi:lipoprotein-anchoring transpeptidase ErfK/SrfK